MPDNEDTTAAASRRIRAALDGQSAGIEPATESGPRTSDPVDRGTVRFGGAVVAGSPDDAMSRAVDEIAAALNGEPTPGFI